MFGIGEGELVLILLFAFLVFGPDKLPGMGRTLGRALRQFKNAQEGFTEVVQTNIVDPAAEALSDDAKRPNRRRAEALDEDADIEAADGADKPRPQRSETFAERKKRLAAEKAAREAAEKEAAEAAAATAAADGADLVDDSDADITPDSETPVVKGAAAQPQPAGAVDLPASTQPASKPSLTDLYTMHRPSREESAAGDEVPLDASREASEAPEGAERRAGEGDLVSGGAPTTTEKEAE